MSDDEDVSYSIETAPSGRSTCRTCYNKIALNTKRVCERIEPNYDRGDQYPRTNYHHLECFKKNLHRYPKQTLFNALGQALRKYKESEEEEEEDSFSDDSDDSEEEDRPKKVYAKKARKAATATPVLVGGNLFGTPQPIIAPTVASALLSTPPSMVNTAPPMPVVYNQVIKTKPPAYVSHSFSCMDCGSYKYGERYHCDVCRTYMCKECESNGKVWDHCAINGGDHTFTKCGV